MDQILSELYEEHRNMAALLDAVDRQIAIHDRGGTPDYELLEAVVDYFLEFPDHTHHPKEDLVFAKLRLHDPETAAEIGDLHADHVELAGLTRAFAEGFDRLLQSGAMPGGWFDHLAREFIDFLRRHMQMEEERFLPAAQRTLTEADWVEIRADLTLSEIARLVDPERERLDALRKDILTLSNDAGG